MALSPVKQNAIALRVKPKEDGTKFSIAEIMEALGRSRQTWYNWIEEEEFREELMLKYDKHISIKIREELYWRLHFPNFPLDAVLKLYLADKQKHESDIQNQTLTDLIRKAHEEKEVDTRTEEEKKEDTKRMIGDLLCYLGKDEGQQVMDRAAGYYEEHCR